MKPLINPKQEKFVQLMARSATNPNKQGLSRAEAYRLSYNPAKPEMAGQYAGALMRNEEVRARYQYLVERYAPLDKALSKLDSLCDATKRIYHEGEMIDEIPDNGTQLAAARSIVEAHRPAKADVEIDARRQSVNVSIPQERISQVSQVLDLMLRHTEGLDSSDSTTLED